VSLRASQLTSHRAGGPAQWVAGTCVVVDGCQSRMF
jgi:hypothetical protein